ncbi:MAG TPA: lysophospholipid acyltransferase family protein [Solirubrobacteraceae bacterium]|nr:lysophospholipid acyltransferase family protein [Solirubrobacteraceae bacterium]
MPDVELKPQVYTDPRPKEFFDQYHERVRDHEPEWVYELVHAVTLMWALVAFRARGFGTENVPNGPVILAPNHASFMDHFFTGAFLRRRVQFMGKSQMFGSGPFSWVYTHGGVFPVRRGHKDEEAFVSAFRILSRGGAVVMYCEGGRSRSGGLAETARPGIGRLALESGVPVVPTAILGSYQVRNWKRLQFPRVTVQFGDPFKFERIEEPDREQQQQAADQIFGRIKTLHASLAAVGHRGARKAALTRSRSRPPQ